MGSVFGADLVMPRFDDICWFNRPLGGLFACQLVAVKSAAWISDFTDDARSFPSAIMLLEVVICRAGSTSICMGVAS